MLVVLRHGGLSSFTTQVGWIGVDLFFVLSGFLVSGLLFTEFRLTQKIRPWHFLVRRGFKIYPLFYIMVGLYLFYFNYTGSFPGISHVYPELFFYQNYRPGLMGISWSLAVEEHFYILLAIGIFLLARKNDIGSGAIIPRTCFLLAGFCLAARTITVISQPFSVYTHLFPTHLRIDSLAFGVWLSWCFHFRQQALRLFLDKYARWLLGALPFLFALVCLRPVNDAWVLTIGLTALYTGFGILLILSVIYEPYIAGVLQRWHLATVYRLTAAVGRFSYAIYLVHLLAGPFVSHQLNLLLFNNELPAVWVFVLNMTGSILAGIVLTTLVEWPSLRLRNRLYPGISNAVPASLPAKA